MKAEKMFLALMRSKGFTDEDFKMNKGRYVNQAMQSRWSYFLAGWEMRGAMPQEMRDVL
jgi:hypothetical protein